MRIIFERQVKYREVDLQGFLFNAVYFEIADEGLAVLFRHLGWSYGEMVAAGFDPSVVETRASFRRPARLDDELIVSVVCGSVGTTSFRLHTRLTTSSTKIADINTVYVNVEAASARSRAIPEKVRCSLVSMIDVDRHSGDAAATDLITPTEPKVETDAV